MLELRVHAAMLDSQLWQAFVPRGHQSSTRVRKTFSRRDHLSMPSHHLDDAPAPCFM